MKKDGFMANTLNFAIAKYVKILSKKELYQLAALQGNTTDFSVGPAREDYVFKKIFPILQRWRCTEKRDNEKDMSTALYRIMEMSFDEKTRKNVLVPVLISYISEARLVLSIAYHYPELVSGEAVAEYLQYLVSKRILI